MSSSSPHRLPTPPSPTSSVSFRIPDVIVGCELCNDEVGIRKELTFDSPAAPPSTTTTISWDKPTEAPTVEGVDLDTFEKEMMGLTNIFPAGEVSLNDFIAKNTPLSPNQPRRMGLPAAES